MTRALLSRVSALADLDCVGFRYYARMMTTRDELKNFIDQMPEHSVKSLHHVLKFHLNRPSPSEEERGWDRRTESSHDQFAEPSD